MIAWFGMLARMVIGGIWIVAAVLKLPDPAGSVRAVRAYRILPEAVVPTVGYLLPVVELVVGVLLVAGLLIRASAMVSAILFAAFVAGIGWVWSQGIEIDCGCFGGGGPREGASADYPWELARDLGLLAASAWLVRRPRSPWALDNLIFPSHERSVDGHQEPAVPV